MLYVTTRSTSDAYTPARVLTEDYAPDGGFFVPLRFANTEDEELRGYLGGSFSQNVAQILNAFFGCRLDGWSVEFAIGRYPVKQVSLNSRVWVAETWHNPNWRFLRLVSGLEKAILQSDHVRPVPSNWMKICAKIAVLFGLFPKLMESGDVSVEKPMDIVLPEGDFSAVMAAWYARKMGLPIGTIVVACKAHSSVWDLIHKGEIRVDGAADKLPGGMERLIHAVFGTDKTSRILQDILADRTCYLTKEEHEAIRKGISVWIVSPYRVNSTQANLYRSTGYLSDPDTALCYSALMDYHAGAGEGRRSLILSEESPRCHLEQLSKSLSISAKDGKRILEED